MMTSFYTLIQNPFTSRSGSPVMASILISCTSLRRRRNKEPRDPTAPRPTSPVFRLNKLVGAFF